MQELVVAGREQQAAVTADLVYEVQVASVRGVRRGVDRHQVRTVYRGGRQAKVVGRIPGRA